ncbi:MAG TPA: DNA repair protein, partial [Lysobacter sp.]
IPDMLANRADIYNLGDVLGGMEDTFLLSYIENCLTSNPVLAPLATRDMADLYVLIDRAMGKEVSTNALSHAYSAAEINEIVATLQKLIAVRDVVYRVNQAYIASAAQADKYRTEPPFKLQGSYRNMGKLAEKISPVMNEAELQQLISDHYLGEAQLLTQGAEENLLKLKELRGLLGDDDATRWAQIKRDFLREKSMGGDEADVGGRVVAQLADIAGGLQAMEKAASRPVPVAEPAPWGEILDALRRAVERPAESTVVQAASRDVPASSDLDRLVERMPAALHGALAPLLDALRATQDQQAHLGTALLQLAESLRGAPGARPVIVAPKAGIRGPHNPTPEEAPLDRALEQFGSSPVP